MTIPLHSNHKLNTHSTDPSIMTVQCEGRLSRTLLWAERITVNKLLACQIRREDTFETQTGGACLINDLWNLYGLIKGETVRQILICLLSDFFCQNAAPPGNKHMVRVIKLIASVQYGTKVHYSIFVFIM